MQGGVGWQGIIPSRAAKMGSIAVDKGIAKVGGPAEFYEQLEPEKIAEHILATSRATSASWSSGRWSASTRSSGTTCRRALREAVHERVQEQLPDIVHEVTDEIGDNIDQLLDVKLMVIRHLEAHPELVNRIFQEVGAQRAALHHQLRLLLRLRAAASRLIFITHALPHWWVLPICGTVRRLRHQLAGDLDDLRAGRAADGSGRSRCRACSCAASREVADVYAEIIADDIVTLAQHRRRAAERPARGPHAPDDRRPRCARRSTAPPGRARAAVRVAVGTREYDAIRESVATEAVDYTMTPLTDPEFNAPPERGGPRADRAGACASCRPPTSPRCCARRCARTSGCSCSTAPCSASAPACVHLAIFGV